MFEIDADGIVRVSARDVTTGKVQRIEVKSSSGLSQEEIEKIIYQKKLSDAKVKDHGEKGLL